MSNETTTWEKSLDQGSVFITLDHDDQDIEIHFSHDYTVLDAEEARRIADQLYSFADALKVEEVESEDDALDAFYRSISAQPVAAPFEWVGDYRG